MNVALVKNSEDDVDGDERRQNQNWLIGERAQESSRRSLEGGANARRHANFVFSLIDSVDGLAQGGIGSKIERECDDGKLALMIYGQRSIARLVSCERTEWDLRRGS